MINYLKNNMNAKKIIATVSIVVALATVSITGAYALETTANMLEDMHTTTISENVAADNCIADAEALSNNQMPPFRLMSLAENTL